MKVIDLIAGKAGVYVDGYKYDSSYYGTIAIHYTVVNSTIMINGSWTKVYGTAVISQAGATLEVWYRQLLFNFTPDGKIVFDTDLINSVRVEIAIVYPVD